MPGGGRAGGGGGRSGKSGRAARRSRPTPGPYGAHSIPPHRGDSNDRNGAPPPAPPQNSNGGTFFGTMAEGVAFGAGASMVDGAVDAVFGPRTIRNEKVVTGSPAPAPAPNAKSLSSDACDIHSKAFLDCINSNENEISKYQFYKDMLVECRRKLSA